MEQIIVEAAPRETRGKNAARRVRLTGQVPAVIYGGKGESQALEVNAKQLGAILRSASGHNTIFKIKIKNDEQTAIVKDWLVDPVKGHLLHVDLLRIAMDVRMRVRIPVHTFGEAQGVKLQGGVFEMVTRKILTDPLRVLAHVVTLRVEEEKPAEVVAADAAAPPAEPEVIKKGKKETEEGEEEEAPAAEKEKKK